MPTANAMDEVGDGLNEQTGTVEDVKDNIGRSKKRDFEIGAAARPLAVKKAARI